MAQHIKIPKDVSEIREKFILGLTKRQFICFGLGFLIGIPTFFLMRKLGLPIEVAIFAMGLVAFPAIICGIYKKNGLYFEKYIKLMIRFSKKPHTRTYKSENIYEMIERQIEINELEKKLKG